MKVLLLGKDGQLGWELQRSLLPIGELLALSRNDQIYCGDLSQPTKLAETIRCVKPNIIFNAAAYTAVDKAESDSDTTRLINAIAPGVLAEEAKRINAWLVHFSTDYVFNGEGDVPWREADSTGPLSVYGKTKLEGEQAIQSTGCKHLIFRTSWVYAARGNNFAKIMLRLAHEREQLNVVCDQFGVPTGAELLADVSSLAIVKALSRQEDVSGIYHLVPSGQTNWFEYAQFVLDYARQQGIELKTGKDAIFPIPTSEYPTPAKRPFNSRLNTEKLKAVFNLELPNWQLGVERMLTEIYGK